MGTILRAACSKCGYYTDLFVGSGMGDCNPQAAIAGVGNDAQLAAALKENAGFQIERKVAVCQDCQRLAVAVRVEYQKENTPKLTAKNHCADCGGILVPVAQDTESVPCPVCEKPVSLVPVGNWD